MSDLQPADEDAGACWSCGRPRARETVEQLRQRTRARTVLMSELADQGLSTHQVTDVITGVRSLAEVMAEHDASAIAQPG